MAPGSAGTGLIVTAKVWAGEMPQALLAVIEIFPLTVLAIAVMELATGVPVQPEGKTQV